jgi:hypothetical protein
MNASLTDLQKGNNKEELRRACWNHVIVTIVEGVALFDAVYDEQ